MKLLYFAWLKQKIGTDAEEITLPDDVNDVADVIAWLKTRGDKYATALKDDAVVRVAVVLIAFRRRCDDLFLHRPALALLAGHTPWT